MRRGRCIHDTHVTLSSASLLAGDMAVVVERRGERAREARPRAYDEMLGDKSAASPELPAPSPHSTTTTPLEHHLTAQLPIMNTALLRTSALRSAARAAAPACSRAGLAGTSFVRGKATLPDLPCTPARLRNCSKKSSPNTTQTTMARSSPPSRARSWSCTTRTTTTRT